MARSPEEAKLLEAIDRLVEGREDIWKRAARDSVAAHLAKSPPAPPQVNVTLDMTPVADAITELGKVLMGVMLKAMTQQKPIEFKPEIIIPETVVNVAAPSVTVKPAEITVTPTFTLPEREPRRVRLEHDDGTTTKFIEE